MEYAPDCFVGQRGKILLAILSVGPRHHHTFTALPVCKEGRRQPPYSLHIQAAQRTTAGVCDITRVRPHFANRFVPQLPKLKETRLLPGEEVAIYGIARITIAGQFFLGCRMEGVPALPAVTHTAACPAVAAA